MRWLAICAVLVAVLAPGCGGDDDGEENAVPERTLEEGLEAAIAAVDKAVEVGAAGELVVDPGQVSGRSRCQDSVGRPTETFSQGYDATIRLGSDAEGRMVIDRIREHWEAQGGEIVFQDDGDTITMLSEIDGTSVSAIANFEQMAVYVGGSVGCLPPAEATE